MKIKLTQEQAIHYIGKVEYKDACEYEAMKMAIEALKREPSEDLISRAEAIEAIKLVDWYHQNKNKDMVHGANSDEHQAWYKAQDIYKALEAVPSADRPRGERKRMSADKYVQHAYYFYRCSKCGYDHIGKTNFCPNCGARMKGADDE